MRSAAATCLGLLVVALFVVLEGGAQERGERTRRVPPAVARGHDQGAHGQVAVMNRRARLLASPDGDPERVALHGLS